MDINIATSSVLPAKDNGQSTSRQSTVSTSSQVLPNNLVQNLLDKEQQAEQVAQSSAASADNGEALQKVVEDMTSMMSVMRKGLAFRVDDTSGRSVVSVMDVDSGNVIRQIPSEEALDLAQKLSDVTGLLMKTEA
ncbi:flagellar protein FlaG [Shewanella sp. NIFS-20-20]|uniref:flagellar protein FlaG n=1 Tax=Shewanella sp. NIFS-20-20 TaxID=2853806 RepID=UPI001C445468|nr:flagellar protein FlaG [Shewanella sp. NIFS-20-20]MBV7314784.1 flagellar protein FlaG [Shewanella sp. NIFS-20-20]